jgi:hypothetical protein
MCGKPDLRWGAICLGVDLVIPFGQTLFFAETSMTTNQAIAMAFPLLTAGVVCLTGYGVTRWVEKQRKITAASKVGFVYETTRLKAIYDSLDQAEGFIGQARRAIEQARQ